MPLATGASENGAENEDRDDRQPAAAARRQVRAPRSCQYGQGRGPDPRKHRLIHRQQRPDYPRAKIAALALPIPGEASQTFRAAVESHRGGDLERAAAAYREILSVTPTHPGALH